MVGQEVYFFEFTVGLLDGTEATWDRCFDTIPLAIDPHAYRKYLKDEIESRDYEPYPVAQVFNGSTEDQIKMVKAELKPKSMAILNFARRRLDRG